MFAHIWIVFSFSVCCVSEKKISVISFMNFEFDVELQVIVKLISTMLTILNVSVHEHWIFFYLFNYWISFIKFHRCPCINIKIFMCVSISYAVCMCTTWLPGAYGDQKRMYDHLELELMDSCESPQGCWEPNLGQFGWMLQESVLLCFVYSLRFSVSSRYLQTRFYHSPLYLHPPSLARILIWALVISSERE